MSRVSRDEILFDCQHTVEVLIEPGSIVGKWGGDIFFPSRRRTRRRVVG